MRTWRGLSVLGSVLLLALGALSGCAAPAAGRGGEAAPAAGVPAVGGAGQSTVGAAQPPKAPSNAGAAPARPVETVRVAVPAKALSFLPFYFGQDKGLFRAEGVDLDLIQMRPTIGITALDAGDVEYTAAPGLGIRAALQGAPMRAIMFAQVKPSFALLGQPGITPERIRTVAVSGLRTTAHYAALAVMRKLGRGGPDDAIYFATNETARSYQALVGQSADAAILSPPFTTMATVAGYAYLGDAFELADVQGGLVTSLRQLREQPAQVRAVMRGTLRSLEYIANHPDELIDYLQREFEMERPVAEGSYDILRQVLNWSGDIDEPTLQAVVNQMKQDAEITSDIPADQVVDMQPLRAARAEIR